MIAPGKRWCVSRSVWMGGGMSGCLSWGGISHLWGLTEVSMA